MICEFTFKDALPHRPRDEIVLFFTCYWPFAICCFSISPSCFFSPYAIRHVLFCASAPAFALRCLVLALLRRPPLGIMLSASVRLFNALRVTRYCFVFAIGYLPRAAFQSIIFNLFFAVFYVIRLFLSVPCTFSGNCIRRNFRN
jgi:hypothetical protein